MVFDVTVLVDGGALLASCQQLVFQGNPAICVMFDGEILIFDRGALLAS